MKSTYLNSTFANCLILLVALLVLPAWADEAEEKPLALTGIDPVLLTQGIQELGKPDFVSADEHFQYHFANQANMNRFNTDKARYGVQNEMCPVVPSGPGNPAIFTVHKEKIYIFATGFCVGQFEASPESFL